MCCIALFVIIVETGDWSGSVVVDDYGPGSFKVKGGATSINECDIEAHKKITRQWTLSAASAEKMLPGTSKVATSITYS